MVKGNGLLANSFKDYISNNSVLMFCSGVSNSLCNDISEFKREITLLKKTLSENNDKLFVYFSTCSIGDTSQRENLYIKHKIDIEKYIESNANNYLIVRLSNVVGFSKNSHTILNYFFNSISKNIPFDLWVGSYRNLIDVFHVKQIVSYILENNLFKNRTINVANKLSVPSIIIVEEIEKFLNIKANYNIINKGENFNIDVTEIESIILKLKINFSKNYIETLLRKYYSSEL